LRLYGQVSSHRELEWAWVDARLREAGTYWVAGRSDGPPHPRPVWGVWASGCLHLSIGTPTTRTALAIDPTVTVHLESGTDVAIVEGRAVMPPTDPNVLAQYDQKYNWSYDVEAFGPLICVAPSTILAWRVAGWAGRDGFQRASRWDFG